MTCGFVNRFLFRVQLLESRSENEDGFYRKGLKKDMEKNVHSFFYKNLFYKNVEAETDPDFKNTLRTYPTID